MRFFEPKLKKGFTPLPVERMTMLRAFGRGGVSGEEENSRKLVTGFTLIELLVVIAIIGILSSVVLTSLNGARQRGRDSKRVTEIKTIQLALEMYFDSCREYPDTLTGTAANGCASGTDLSDFLNPIPIDPTNSGNHVYTYNDDSTHASFVLRAALEDNSNKTLQNDTDGTVLTFNCNDSSSPYYYCVVN